MTNLHERMLPDMRTEPATIHIPGRHTSKWDTASSRVCTVCHSQFIPLMQCCMLKPPCSNFRMITATISSVTMFTVFTLSASAWRELKGKTAHDRQPQNVNLNRRSFRKAENINISKAVTPICGWVTLCFRICLLQTHPSCHGCKQRTYRFYV